MIAGDNRLSFVFAIPGIFLQVAGANFLAMDLTAAWVALTLLVTGYLLLWVGLFHYVRAKARHPAWALLALLDVVGFLILACLEDQSISDNGSSD